MKKLKEIKKPHRIPYVVWANCQLSIAKYYGGCKLEGKSYLLDYKNCRKEMIDGVEKFFPDLVEEVKDVKKTKREKREATQDLGQGEW